MSHRSHRSGVVSLWVLIVLAIVTALIATTSWQYVAARRMLRNRENRLQADWLARAGVELASARLQTDPKDYRRQTIELLPNGRIEIEVTTTGEVPDTFEVSSVASYPADGGPRQVVRTVRRTFTRIADKDGVRMQVAP
jgi:hypothetical protein